MRARCRFEPHPSLLVRVPCITLLLLFNPAVVAASFLLLPVVPVLLLLQAYNALPTEPADGRQQQQPRQLLGAGPGTSSSNAYAHHQHGTSSSNAPPDMSLELQHTSWQTRDGSQRDQALL